MDSNDDNKIIIPNHIYQGDCREVLATFPSKSVDVIFADPPYNMQLQGDLHRPDTTKVDGVNDNWDRFSDFTAYDQFTKEWLTMCRKVLRDTGTLWVIGSYHNIYRIGAILQDLGFWILNDIVWEKVNPLPQFKGVRFTNAHETLLWCKKSKDQKKYTFHYHAMKMMNDEKQMRSVWQLPICSGKERLRVDGRKVHTTQKPESLLYRIILATSSPGDIILDPFFGTGTTGAVAKKLGRRFVGIERELDYIDAAQFRIDTIDQTNYDPEVYGVRQTKRTAPRIPFAQLLEYGLLVPGQLLFFNKMPEKPATILADGSLRTIDGNQGSIHKIGALMAGLPECNGWVHWYYLQKGDFFVIDKLREIIRGQLSVYNDNDYTSEIENSSLFSI